MSFKNLCALKSCVFIHHLSVCVCVWILNEGDPCSILQRQCVKKKKGRLAIPIELDLRARSMCVCVCAARSMCLRVPRNESTHWLPRGGVQEEEEEEGRIERMEEEEERGGKRKEWMWGRGWWDWAEDRAETTDQEGNSDHSIFIFSSFHSECRDIPHGWGAKM